MKHITRMFWSLLVIFIFILSACGKGAATPSASSPNQAYTQIWETVAAGQTQTSAAASPTPQASETPKAADTPKSTITPLVSSTPSGDATAATVATAATAATADAPAATSTKARSTSQATCDNSQYVSDVTYPDGAEVSPGQTFVKTWQIKNLGPCQWNQDYMLTFGWGGDGTEWNKAASTHFSKVVKAGETIDVSIELVAPDEAGSYGGIFRTRNDSDVYFGPTLTAYIVVK